jgi:hypothetical protein
MSDGFYWLQYLLDGGVQWLLPKPWTSSIGQYVQYCTGAPPRPSKWPAKLVNFFIVVLFAVAPGGCLCYTEQVVAQWWRPVASGVALDMPHQAMPSVLLSRTAEAIKMANNRHAFVRHCRLFCMIIRSYKTMLWSIKTNTKFQY